MKWFLNLTTRNKLFPGFGVMIIQNVSGTRPAEVAAQNLHELGQKLQQLAAQYKV